MFPCTHTNRDLPTAKPTPRNQSLVLQNLRNRVDERHRTIHKRTRRKDRIRTTLRQALQKRLLTLRGRDARSIKPVLHKEPIGI